MPPPRLSTTLIPKNVIRASLHHRLVSTRTTSGTASNSTPARGPCHSQGNHSDLNTYLSHAHRTNLDKTSTTYLGTQYEYITQSVLRRYGFELDRVGGRGDGGVDLSGFWELPQGWPIGRGARGEGEGGEGRGSETGKRTGLDVVVQCKRLKDKIGPGVVREVEGVVTRVNMIRRLRGTESGGVEAVLGVLVGQRGASKGVRDAMARSGVGLCWIMLEPDQVDPLIATADETKLGRVMQFLWNPAAAKMALEGIDVVMEFTGKTNHRGVPEKEVALMWNGRRIGRDLST